MSKVFIGLRHHVQKSKELKQRIEETKQKQIQIEVKAKEEENKKLAIVEETKEEIF